MPQLNLASTDPRPPISRPPRRIFVARSTRSRGAGASNPTDELFVERVDGKEYGWLQEFVKRVGLVRKLRETRVLTGFSRLKPKTDRSDPAVQRLAIDEGINWLPAVEVRGEGIFIEINLAAIDAWIERAAAPARLSSLISEFNARRLARNIAARNIDARFMMMHTLAHALIKELTFSLRIRIGSAP